MANLVPFLALLSAFLGLATSLNVVCYFTSWTVYRPGNGKFDVSNIDPSLCTHLYYAFVGLNEDGSLWVMDDWEATGLGGISNLVGLKEQNPNLKVILSMGGWNEGSEKYSGMAEDPVKRARLIVSVLKYIDQYSFDGFDLDWEYPAQRKGDEEHDKDNFIVLLAELREALHTRGKILTAAVSGGVRSMDISYHVKAVSEYLDMINVMVYDFHGAFEDFVGHVAPLYPSHLDEDEDERLLNVASGLQHWIELGANKSKMNMGVGTYGRTFTLANASNPELYAPVEGGGTAGPYTRQEGVLGYNEICELYSDWERIWDDEQKVPHKLREDQWIGYEDAESIRLKVQYAKQLNLAGIMVWSLDTDDFLGICGNGRYPLLHVINDELSK